jgi:hypothetical protein
MATRRVLCLIKEQQALPLATVNSTQDFVKSPPRFSPCEVRKAAGTNSLPTLTMLMRIIAIGSRQVAEDRNAEARTD